MKYVGTGVAVNKKIANSQIPSHMHSFYTFVAAKSIKIRPAVEQMGPRPIYIIFCFLKTRYSNN